MSKELEGLHVMLVKQYMELMKKGIDDPRVLKEIRELLKDNSITGDIIGVVQDLKEEIIELPDDFLEVLNG